MTTKKDRLESSVMSQFGANAAKYATSSVHAKGSSLAMLVEMAMPQPDWFVLDVATGAGHTAHKFAPHVQHVWSTDLTPEMLVQSEKLASEKGLYNITYEIAAADALPYEDGKFDCVTCRIAPHHFPNVPAFVQEVARVLKPNGVFGLVDNIVPGGNKKKDQQAGEYVNAFEKLRDPSHHQCLDIYAWRRAFRNAGIQIINEDFHTKKMDFDPWADRMQVSDENKTRLRAMLRQAPERVAAFLTPEFTGDRINFQLTEAVLIGRKLGD